MIDFTKPVETAEDPPRPVRVLATDCGGDYPIAVLLSREPRLFTKDGYEWLDQDGLALRNVPAKPVLHEVWVILEPNGNWHWNTSEPTAVPANFEVRHIVWNSDGSPVEDDPLRYGVCETCVEKAVKSADEWRSKAEALDRDLEYWRKDSAAAWDKCEEYRLKAETLQAEVDKRNDSIIDHLERIRAMKPVVEAAVAYNHATGADCHNAYNELVAAADEFENAQPATSDSHEAFVDDMVAEGGE